MKTLVLSLLLLAGNTYAVTPTVTPTVSPTMTPTPGPIAGVRYFQIPITSFRLPGDLPFEKFSGIWSYSLDGNMAYVRAFDLKPEAIGALSGYKELTLSEFVAAIGADK